MKKAQWLEERRSELLPAHYFHVVFTIDHQVNSLALWNAQIIYNLLFLKASECLKAFGRKYLGGEMGFIAVLHTWGQDLGQHIHLHFIVVGGALSSDRTQWKSTPKDFLFPVVELSACFRDSFCDGLAEIYRKKQLKLGGSCAELEDPERFNEMLSSMREKKWEVYAKEPFGGPEQVLSYLARYMNRVAISNNRLISVEGGQVLFRYRDNRDGGKEKMMSLPAEEFIDRFLLHVLPDRFVRIRYYGFLQGKHRQSKLEKIHELLGSRMEVAKPEKESYEVLLERLTGIDLHVCPICKKGRMVRRLKLVPVEKGGHTHAKEVAVLLDAA